MMPHKCVPGWLLFRWRWPNLAVISLLLSAAVPAIGQNAAATYYLPHLADGGSDRVILRSSIILANTGSKAAKATVNWVNGDGSPRTVGLVDGGRVSSAAVTLDPGAVREFRTDGSGDGSSGAAVVKADSTLSVSAALTVQDASSGAVLGESIVEAPEMLSSFRVPLDSVAGGPSTGIALFNPGTATASVRASVVDGSGGTVENAFLTLRAGERLEAWAGSDLFPGLSGQLPGATIQIDSSAPVAAVGLRHSPTSMLFPVADSSSRRTKFFLPQIADGQAATGGGKVATVLMVTNTSEEPSVVRVSLAREDGSALAIGFGGKDASEAFVETLGPGASAIWETAGAGEYAKGSAVIQASRPLAVAALLRTYDADGVAIAESGLAETRKIGLSLLAVNEGTSAIAAQNPGSTEVTLSLTLLGSDGGSIGTATLGPVASRGSMTAKLADLFPGQAGNGRAVRISTGGPLEGSVAVAAIREGSDVALLNSWGPSALPVTGAGITVRPTVDAARTATAQIGAAGGTLSLTDAKGTRFTLTIPAKALLGTETIRMTSVTRLDGIPGGGSISAAVQLEPDGLTMAVPATLQIVSATPLGDNIVPIGWHGSGQGVYINLIHPDRNRVAILLNHFSGAGTGGGFDFTSMLATVADMMELQQSIVASHAIRARQLPEDSPAQQREQALYFEALQEAYQNAIEPFMRLALSSRDLNLLLCALGHVQGYGHDLSVTGVIPDGATDEAELSEAQREARAIEEAIRQFRTDAMNQASQVMTARCQERRDPAAHLDMVAMAHEFAVLGNQGAADALMEGSKACYPALRLEVTSSKIELLNPTFAFTGSISAKVTLRGEFDKRELTQVVDASKDLFASYVLSGEVAGNYDSAGYTIPGCSAVVTRTADVYKVIDKEGETRQSRIRYKFFSKYRPEAVTSRGQQLCSYCPVRDLVTDRIEMLVDPGVPMDKGVVTCSPVPPQTVEPHLWRIGWGILQAQDRSSSHANLLTNWELVPRGETLATKEFRRQAPDGQGGMFFETSSYKLIGFTP